MAQVLDLAAHHSQAHLAVPAGARVGPLQIDPGIPNIDDMGLEHEAPVHALLVVRRHLVDLAVVQLQRHDAAVGRAVEDPPVRQDRGRARARVQLVDLHAADLVRPVVHLLHEDVVALEAVDEHPLRDLRRRALSAHVHHEVRQRVIGLGEHVVVEEHQGQGEHRGGEKGGADDAEQVDPVGPHRGDLIVLGQSSECGQAGDQDGAGDGQSQHPAHGQGEELEHDSGGNALPDRQIDQVEKEVQSEQENDDAEADQEREEVLAQHVPFEYSHMALPFNTFRAEPLPVPGVHIFT